MEAMALVRAHFGADAVIISTQEDGNGGTRVTAALDDDSPPPPETERGLGKVIAEALVFHGVASEASEAILDAALAHPGEGAIRTLAGALGSLFRFAPLETTPRRAVALIGPHGSGKTAAAAKLAARAVLAHERARLVTTDTVRAGGIAQLESFARILGVPFQLAEGPGRLAAAIAAADRAERVFVDTSGVNPFSAGDRSELAALIAAGEIEPVLVFAAGGDVEECAGMSAVFRDLGCARMIVTRLDAVQRVGALLAAAHGRRLAFAEAGIAPDIADGLVPFTPTVLARLLLPKGSS